MRQRRKHGGRSLLRTTLTWGVKRLDHVSMQPVFHSEGLLDIKGQKIEFKRKYTLRNRATGMDVF